MPHEVSFCEGGSKSQCVFDHFGFILLQVSFIVIVFIIDDNRYCFLGCFQAQLSVYVSVRILAAATMFGTVLH